MIFDANFNNEIGKKLTDVLEIQQDFIFEIGLTQKNRCFWSYWSL